MNVRKRALAWVMTLLMIFSMIFVTDTEVMAGDTPSATIYVATTGDDTTGDGTQAMPYKTLAKAKEVVRTLPKTGGDIVVQIADGFYPLDETLAFDKNDSGSADCTIRYEAAPGAKPVISGGQMLDKGVWEAAPELTQTGGLTAYKTTLNRSEKLRAIYVNDKRANMTLSPTIASGNRTVTGTPTVSFTGVDNPWAWQNGSNIRAAIVFSADTGLKPDTRNPQNIEAESLGGARWARPFVCFASAEAAPAASNMPGGTMLRFQMPYAAISQSLSNNTQYNAGGNQVIRNAFEFFNKRGDFYFDQAESTLYYIPLEDEDINIAEVVIPKLETVVDIRGIPVGDRLNPVVGSDEGRVTNITFDGLTFAHTDYKLYELEGTYTLSDGSGPVTTNSRGFASVQGCIVNKVYFPSSINWHETFYRGYDIPPAAVMVNAARNIKVLNGQIEFTGFNGIHLENDVKNCEVTGNYIADTLASGVVVGHPQHIYENDTSVHESSVSVSGTPIKNWAGANKEKFVYGTEAVPEDVYITNNFLYRNCYGFPGANSLTSFYTTNMQVLHNYLYDSTYGAMSIGWGWCEYDGFGHTAQGTVKDGGPYAGTSEGSLARSPAISTTSRNNKINYNRVEEICTVVNDSGAIYSLGRQGDPGNLLGGGTWDTVNNLTSSPVTDETSNWHPDNWTNYTEMNYNFLDPNPSNKPTTSNNWTNGFHPDEGSTFIKMIGNVVQSKLSHSPGRSRLYEFNNWKRKSDMIAIEGYVDGDNDQNGGPRITFDNYKSADRIWPAEGNQIVLNSGLTDEYTHMIPRSLIADTEFELASNIIMGKGEKLSRRGLLEHGDTVWLAPAGTTEFVEGNTMTKAAGDAKTIDAPSAPGEYKLYIVYADSSKGTATSKYTAYVDTSATAVNVKNGESYEVSAVQPLKLTLSEDYTYTLNGNPVVDGYEIATEGSWDLVLSTPSSPNATTIKFTTTVSEANKLLAANKTVAPGETVRFAYDLNDKSKKIWISSPAGGHFDGGDDETMVYGDKLGITAPEVSGTYAIFVLSKDDEVLSQSHARVVVSETAPVDPSVDKTLLTALIDATDDLDSAVYTTNSWNTFASALSEAQAAASNNEIGQEAADNAYFALRNAFKSLRVATDIFIEAESATVYGPFSGRNWSVVKGQYTQAMHALPDSGYVQSSTSAANLANTPRLSYTVNIPVAGNYTVWVLAKTPSYDSDSLHVGLDNTYKFSANSIHDDSNGAWKWVNLSNRISAGSALQNVTAGQHTLDIWFREDGFAVDRIFLTQSTLTADPVWFGQTAVLDKNSLTLAEGSAGTLTATVTPEDEADKTVTFSSSNEAVATVTGKVYDEETGATSITVNAIAVGTASIIATTANGSQTACDVTVTEKPAPNKNIYVSTTGDDTTGDGTQAKPYKTLAKAKEVVRTLPKTGGDIVVQIADGFYPLEETLAFDKNDSGSADCTIRYEAAPGAKPVISGGQMLDKGVWEVATGLTQTGGLTAYKTTLNRSEKLRAIYVNDKRANMTLSPTIASGSRTTTGTPTVSFTGTGNDWAWQNGSNIRAAIVFSADTGLKPDTRNPQNIEAESLGGARWARPFVCFASAEEAPAASNMPGGTMLRFQMPYAAISQSLSNNTQYNAGNNQVIRNAFEFLNKRGDFYFDQAGSTLYYIPLEGEDINTAEVVIPKIETVVDIRGIPVGDRLNPVAGSDEGRVTNITFDGLTFAHTDYKLYELEGTYTLSDGSGPVTTNSRGFASVQGCIVNKVYFPSSINWHETFYRGYDIPPAAVMVNAARNIKVLNGQIEFTGFNGIHLENDVKNCEVTGNYIADTLASGVVVGHPQHIYENDTSVHESSVSVSGTPIKNWAGANKEKFVYGTEAVPEDVYIKNNFLYRNCYGFPGANSLTSFYTTNMQVLHNYLYDSTYGAMSIGWGWCEYDGFGYTEAGLVNTNKTGGPYAGTHEDSRGRSTAISTTSRNNKINYNRVEEICTVVNDSGAIYSLGRQGDPGNLPDGGTWYTVNNLTSSPVIDETSNWHPDNWTNYTEMNYNFLDPNPSNKPTTSNNWTNGFHPDEGSTFIKMIGNVVQSKLSHSPGRSRLYEFNNWKRKSDMIAIEGYVDGNNDQNGGPRITFDNYKSEERIWPVKGNEIVLNSGLEDEYTHMIPRSLIADTEFELASNVIMGKGDKLNRRGLLKAEDTVWFAPADTTVFTEGDTMTKAAGDAKTIDAPSAPGAYKLYIVYADSSKGTATSKYTAYVDTSASAVNVEDGKSYEVSAVRPLKLALSKDYTYTLNGKSIVDGYEIATEGSWTLVLSTSSSANTTTIKFTTTVSVANKLLTADVQVAPDGTVRFAYDLNDATKEIWISSSSDGNFVESEKETKASGDKLGMIAPHLPGPYVIYVRSSEGEVLGQSHARVVVRDMTPVDIPRNGLDLWLKADEGVETDSEGNVTGWTNMGSVTAKLVPADVPGSGGDNLGQPSGNPTLKKDGYDYVDFAAMSRPLKYAGFKDYNGKTEMTIFTLANPTTTANNSSDQSGLVYFGLNEAYQTWPANNGWSGINLGIGTNRVNIRFGNANGGVQGGGQSISTTISGLSSVRAQLNGVNRDIYVNDTRIGGGTNATALAGNRPDLGIGYTMAAATPYRFLGRVAQVLIYDRVLTTDEIAKVEAYFNLVKAGGGGPANAVPSGVDKTLLTALIEDVNNLDNTIYTTDSWNAFASALSEAEAAASNNEIEQGAADNAYFALRDAFKALALLPSGSGTAVYGTPVLGGTELDPLWNTTVTLPVIKHLTMANGPTDGSAKVLWDDNNLYVLVRVKDPVLNSSSGSAHEQDSVEIFVDETNIKGTSYGTGMGQYRINYLNAKSFNPSSISAGFESFAKVVDGGYYLEVKIPFKVAVPRNAHKIGFDLQINDAGATGGRQDIIMWHDQTGNSWQNGSQWGVVTLVGKTSDTYEVTFGTEGGNGSVVAEVDNAQITSGASIEAGKDVVFTATPDTGYRVKGWKLNGSAVSGNTSNTYTLESLSAAAAVTVEFEAVTVDKAGLAEAISTAQALSQSAYTPESWQTMQIALQAATLLNANPAATQEQVDGVTQELQEAIAGLVAVTPVNKTGLAAAISTAGGLSQSAYTPESWQTMQTALQAAISVNDDEDATQGEVDVASAALQTAINGLVAVTPVNKALLAAAISIAEALSESAYTSDSWETMQTALAEAISVNEKEDATQQEVDDAKVELQAAIDGLVVEGEDVNKDLLNAVIATAEALSQNAYTAESWQAMQTALEAAISVNDNTDATQSEVDAASAALQTAIDELEVVTPVNKDLLAAVIVAANELNENAYTAQSWQAMKTALDNAISVNDNVNATQDEVNAASAALQTAIDELEAVTPVNKALLEAEISRVQGLSEDDYTAESWQAMQTALTNATSVNANAAATQQQVDAATADLKTAIEELVAVTPSADKTELEAEIEKAQGLNKNDYTAESWQAMQTALTAATSVNEKEDATQQEVDEAKAALKTAIDALEEVSPSVDKTGLEAEISRTQGLSESAYTAESWQAMQTALTAATSVNEKEDATQQEVDEAKAALKTAIDALVAVTPSADKTELAAEIIRAQGLSESAYTAESWQAMKTALTAAISVNANADATQQEVDAAKTALQAAISALVVKTPTYTGGGNSSTPTPAPPTAKVENGAITVVTPKVNAATGEAKAAPITKADIEKALKGTTPDSSGASTVKVEIPAAQGAKAYSVQLPQTVLASETGNSRIQINTGIATATLPANMFASQGVKDSDKMEIVIAKVDKKDLDAGLQAQVADKPVVDLSIKINGKTVEWKNSNAPVTVKIPYEASKKELENAAYLTVWYLDGNGNVIVVPNAKYDSVEKVVTFTTTHFSKYVIAFVQKTFNDIAKYHWIVEPVQVLASKDIVEGTSKEEFSPDKNITRGEFIMWLVKTLGLTAEFDTNFNDVKSTDIYYEQLGIAKKLGIAQGGGGNTYNPGKEISRQDMMALTIRAMKAAGRDLPVGTESDIERFEDASKVASYAIDHVSTMVKAKLIQGSGKNLNPTAQTTRAEVAIMLYRIYANK